MSNNTEPTMKQITLFIVTILLLSCNAEKTQKNETIDRDISKVEVKPAAIKDDTSFLDFFEKFMWDNEFQKSRVLFPIQQNGKEINTAEEWNYLPFYTQCEYIPTVTSDTSNLFEKNENPESTEMFLIDFKKEMAEKFAFKKVNKKWYLTRSGKATFATLPDSEFIAFLINFSKDSIFQLNHITFPLSESFADSEKDYEIVTTEIKSTDWEYWKLTDDPNKLMVLSNIQKGNNYRTLFFRGVENGISVKYTFKKINKTWKLIRLEDYST
jgi:hypothetical protein